MDVSRLRDDVGFTAQYDLESGLKAYLQWREEFSFQE
jgi:nucleoside-diphosphate-sugar epimerase